MDFCGDGTPLSLEGAIQMALAKNPMIAAAQSQLEASGARITQARSGLLPQLNFSENYSRTNSPTGVFSAKLNQGEFTQQDFDVNRLNNPHFRNNFATVFSVTLPVFDSGQNWIGLSQAKLDHQAVTMAVFKTRQQVIADTVTSYFGVLLARENLTVVEEALNTAQAHLDLVCSRLRSGLVVKSDLLRAEVRVAELEQERLQAQSQLEISRSSLNATIGTEVNRVFCLTTPLERASRLRGALTAWTNKAMEHRPDLTQLKLQETMAEKEVSKSKAAHLPSVHLVGNYEINSEDFNQTNDNYTVGAMLRFNLYSGHNLQSKIWEANARLRQVRAALQQLELAVAVQVKQAFLQAGSAWHRIKVAQGAVTQAEEGLRIVRNRYENGLYTIVNLLDAELALQQARTNHLRSLHDYKVATTQLLLAAGILNENLMLDENLN
jgi:TolC family type I secretion outer membrane protein